MNIKGFSIADWLNIGWAFALEALGVWTLILFFISPLENAPIGIGFILMGAIWIYLWRARSKG